MDPQPIPAGDSARAVFLAWERLRLVYNAALAAVVLVFGTAFFGDRSFWKFLAVAAVLANVCFCLGPVVEGYLSLLGLDRRLVRWFVFVPGTLLGCLLTLGSLLSWGLRDFD